MFHLCLYILIYAIITTKTNANILGTGVESAGVRGARTASEEQIRSREQPHRSLTEVHRSVVNARPGPTSWLIQTPAEGHQHSPLPLTHLARRQFACPITSPNYPLNISRFEVEWGLNWNHGMISSRSSLTNPFILTYNSIVDNSFANTTLIVDLWHSNNAQLSNWAQKEHINAVLKSDRHGAAEHGVKALRFDSSSIWPISLELHCSINFHTNRLGLRPTIPARVISNRTEYLILAPDNDRNVSKTLDLCVRPGTRLLRCMIPQDLLKDRESSNAYQIIPARRNSESSPAQVLAWLHTQEPPSLGTTPEPESILAWVPLNQERPLPQSLPHARVEHFVTRDAYVISLDDSLRDDISCSILAWSSPNDTNANTTTFSPEPSLITVALSRTLTFDKRQFDSNYACQPKAERPETEIIKTPLYLPNSAPLFAATDGLKAAKKSISTRVSLRASPSGRVPLVNMLLLDHQASEKSSGAPTLLLDSFLKPAQDTETGSFNLWFRLNNPTPTLPESDAEPSLFSQLDARSMVELYYDTLLGGNNGFKGDPMGKASNNDSGDGEREVVEKGFTLIPHHFYHSKLPPCTLALKAFLLFANDQELSLDRTHPALKEAYYDTVPIVPGAEGGKIFASERQFVCLRFSTNSSQNQIAFAGAIRHAVQFQSRARFLNLPDSRAVKRGSTVRFKCSGLGLPPPRITWLKDGLPLTSSGKVSIVTPWSIKANHPRAPTPPLRGRRPSLTLAPKTVVVPTVSKKRKFFPPVIGAKMGGSKGSSHIADLVVSNVQEGDTGAYQCLLTQVALGVPDGSRNYTLLSPPAHLSLVVLEHEPAAPVAVRGVAIEPTSAFVSWGDPANTGSGNPNLLAYSVHYTAISKINGTLGERPSKMSESQVIVDPGKRRILLKRLEPGTLYEIYLVAYNAFSASPNSVPIKLAMPPAIPSSGVGESKLISGEKNTPVKSVGVPNETGTRPVNDMPYVSIEEVKSPTQKMPVILGGKGPNASTWMSYKGEMSRFEKIGDPGLTFEYSNVTQTLTVFYNRIVPNNHSHSCNAWSSYVSGEWTLVYFPIFAQNNPSGSKSDYDKPLFLSSLELRPPRVSSKMPDRNKDFVTLTGLLQGTLYAFRLIKNASELRDIRAHINAYLSSTALRAPAPLNNETATTSSSSSPMTTYKWYNDNNHASGPPNLTNNLNNFAESIRRGWSFYLLPLAVDSPELEKGMRVEKMVMVENTKSDNNVKLYTKVIESWLLATILIAVTVIVLVVLATIYICRRRARDLPSVSLNKHYYTGIAVNGLNGHRNHNSTHFKECSRKNETQPDGLLATECLPLRSPLEIGLELPTRANPLTAYV